MDFQRKMAAIFSFSERREKEAEFASAPRKFGLTIYSYGLKKRNVFLASLLYLKL